MFQHTATRRWLPHNVIFICKQECGFNTQPPEGGCNRGLEADTLDLVSTHSHPKVAATPEELAEMLSAVSTHSHPKVAAIIDGEPKNSPAVSTHSHPKVAALFRIALYHQGYVSTHSHPKVAADRTREYKELLACFNTQPPEGGCLSFT